MKKSVLTLMDTKIYTHFHVFSIADSNQCTFMFIGETLDFGKTKPYIQTLL